MIELNIRFQEEYKRLDIFCKDVFSSQEGVSEYIRQMDATPWQLRKNCYSWDADYKMLKHLRWLRNTLAHDVNTLYEDICTEDDIIWLKNFSDRILSVSDPLAIAFKTKISNTNHQEKQTTNHNNNLTDNKSNKNISFWAKLKAKIKNFFS